MKVLGVIPARFAATRFPGKPLAPILGRPMIEWVIAGAMQSKKLSEVLVATDDHRIADVCKKLNCKAVMTESSLPSGTDRIFAAVQGLGADVVINIQGDEPLVQGSTIDSLISPFENDRSLEMATLAQVIAEEEYKNPNVVKVIFDKRQNAIYFSRFGIPYSRIGFQPEEACVYKHIGMYGYRFDFLKQFCETSPAPIEQAEALEQLRALWLGAKIKVVQTKAPSIGVDAPEDVARVEELLKKRS